MRNNSHFGRGQQPTFSCAVCRRRTRQTIQPQGSDLCAECWELAGLDNSVNDGGDILEDVAAERDRLVAIAVSRGGDHPRIVAAFDFLFPGGRVP